MISLIIPTKNRKSDIKNAVLSVIRQKRLPDELIIVDQSQDLDIKIDIEELLFKSHVKINTIYIYNPNINGLVQAKKSGFESSSGELLCFIEDDVVLQNDYLLMVEKHFALNPKMLGCCGVDINFQHCSNFYIALYNLTHRGIFKDHGIEIKRQKSSNFCDDYAYESNFLSGGISSWKRLVIKNIPFDTVNNFHYLEDIDYSTRASYIFGNVFYIIPSIKLIHNFSTINRESLSVVYTKKVIEYITYFKKRRGRAGASNINLSILLLGIFCESILKSFRYYSFGPIFGFLIGSVKGAKKNILNTTN